MRLKEYTDDKDPNLAVTEHTAITDHKYILADVRMLVKEDSDFKKNVKEDIAIHKSQPVLNRDHGHKIHPVLIQLVLCDRSGHVTEQLFNNWERQWEAAKMFGVERR